MTKDHEEEVEAAIHDLQGFLCALIHLGTIKLRIGVLIFGTI
jgi:hypothetical protein